MTGAKVSGQACGKVGTPAHTLTMGVHASTYLDDGSNEFQEEAGDPQQRGEEAVQEVHDEALDVRAVVVLVGHDHEVAVAQR